MAKTVADIVTKQIKNVQNSIDDIRKGVEGVTEAPGKKAAAAKDKMKANLIKAIDSGKWGENTAAVTVEEWRTAFLTKGLNRISEGIAGAADKLTNFHTQLQAHQAKYLPELHKMNNLTLEDNILRMGKNAREMSKFRFKR